MKRQVEKVVENLQSAIFAVLLTFISERSVLPASLFVGCSSAIIHPIVRISSAGFGRAFLRPKTEKVHLRRDQRGSKPYCMIEKPGAVYLCGCFQG